VHMVMVWVVGSLALFYDEKSPSTTFGEGINYFLILLLPDYIPDLQMREAMIVLTKDE